MSKNNTLTEQEQDQLYKHFSDGSANIKIKAEHWAHGGDEGFSYCCGCCKKEVARLQKEDPENSDDYFVDGGWGSESDSIAHCKTCGVLLENTLTDCGALEEVRHFLGYGFDPKSESDCHSMDLVIDARGWQPWNGNLEYYEKLNKLGRVILKQLGGEDV